MRCNAYSPEHTHETVAQTKKCWHRHYFPHLYVAPVAPPPPPPVSPSAPASRAPGAWRNEAVTEAQIAKVEKLGGDTVHAYKLTKGQCSDYIRDLINNKNNAPAPTPEPAPYVAPRPSTNPKLELVKGMIDMVADGNYATAPQGEDMHSDFVRIVQRRSGKYRNCRLIQTRHGMNLKDRIIIHPSGYWEMLAGSWNCLDMLMEIIQDQKNCAIRYSVVAVACFHCATPLTDDRSRHYLVGPICEKEHGITWSVAYADEWNGATYEQLVARGKERNQHHASFLSVRAS